MFTAVLVAAGAYAATVNYTGANGGSFSDASNWSGGALPTSADTAVVSGCSSLTIDSDVTIGGLTVKGTPFTLAGSGKLILGAAETVISNGIDTALECEISGSGKLVWYGTAPLRLRHANTFTGGVFTDNGTGNLCLHVYNGASLGTGTATFAKNTRHLATHNAITIPNNLVFKGSTQDVNGCIQMADAGVSFTGAIDMSECKYTRLVASGSGSFTFGALTMYTTSQNSWSTMLIAGKQPGNCFVFAGGLLGYGVMGSDNPFTYHFNAAGNELQRLNYYNATGGKTSVCNVVSAFTDKTEVRMFRNAKDPQVLDLNGYSQTIESIYDADSTVAISNNEIVTSAAAARLTMKGTSDRFFSGRFDGMVSLCWQPTGTYTLTLDGAAHGTTGEIVVSNGTVQVSSGASFGSISSIEVAPGATLAFGSGSTCNVDLDSLSVGEGSSLSFGDETVLFVNKLWTVAADGTRTAMESGKTYTSSDIAALGSGVSVKVEHAEQASVPVTWTGGGANTAFATEANWSAMPDLAADNAVATFATGGSSADVTAAASLKGIVFDAANNFDIGGDAALTIYEGGIDAADTSAARVYNVSTPLTVAAPSVWTVGENATVKLSGTLGGLLDTSIRTEGEGAVYFMGNGGDFAGDVTLSNATVSISGTGLGTSYDGTVEISGIPYNQKGFYFSNATVNKAIRLVEDPSSSTYGSGKLFVGQAGTSTFNGPITLENNYVRLKANSGCTNVYNGGMTTTLRSSVRGAVVLGAGMHVFAGKPFDFNAWMSDVDGNSTIAVSSNKVADLCLGNSKTGNPTMRIAADKPFVYCANFRLRSNARLYLDGHDMEVSNLQMADSANAIVESDSHAVLRLKSQSSAIAAAVQFCGGASLEKAGSATLTLTGASSSTGTVEVTSGTLTIGEGGSWTNAAAVKATGGVLSLGHSQAIGRHTDVHVANGAYLHLASGVQQIAGYLYLDGSDTPASRGVWGATGSGAQHIDDEHFTGSGTLTLLGDGSGLTVIIR